MAENTSVYFRNEPYFEEAVRKHVCSQCEHFGANGLCHVPEPAACPLSRDLPLMVMEETALYLNSRWPKIFEGREMPFKIVPTSESFKTAGPPIDEKERHLIEKVLGESKQKLKEASDELSRSYKELEQFAAIAAHDLKSPLRNIVAFSERLEDLMKDAPEGTAKVYLHRVRDNAFRMKALIDDLLQYSGLTAEPPAFEETDLNALVREVLSDFEAVVAETKAEIILESLPVIMADKLQMRLLFQNLIGNALKYRAKDGSPKIRIHGLESAEGLVEIRIQDNGIGFDMKYKEKIFQPFLRLHGKSEYEGSGVGLAICQKVVAHHGGRLTAESAPGRGATFIIQGFPRCSLRDSLQESSGLALIS